MTFAISALFFVYLKTRGENPADHPVKKELDTVKSYLKKLKATQEKVDLRERQKSKKAAAEEEMGANAPLRLTRTHPRGRRRALRWTGMAANQRALR